MTLSDVTEREARRVAELWRDTEHNRGRLIADLVDELDAVRDERAELLACVIEHHNIGRIDEMRGMGQCTICRDVREQRALGLPRFGGIA